MRDDIIFIHIPKTGGTTINASMNGTIWQTEVGFNYRHIIKGKRTSNAGDIFKPENLEKYKEYKIFMMLRDPVDRILSEYYFFRERKQFMNLLSKQPDSLEDFVRMEQSQNYMLAFLLGRRIFTKKRPTGEELDQVIKTIDEIPIHVGIFEYFSESLGYFEDVLNIEWDKKMEAKRMTFIRPSVNEISEDVKQLIRERNALDQSLYDHCLEKFKPMISKYKGYKVKFDLDKYTHIYPYMRANNLFQFCLNNRYFMDRNFDYFKSLTFHLIDTKKITDGRTLVVSWIQSVLNSIKSNFGDGKFYQALKNSVDNSKEPLEQLVDLGQAIDHFFDSDRLGTKEFYKPMVFKVTDIEIGTKKRGVSEATLWKIELNLKPIQASVSS